MNASTLITRRTRISAEGRMHHLSLTTKALIRNHTKSTLVERITQHYITFPPSYETQPDRVQQQYNLRGLCCRCVRLGFSRLHAGVYEAVISGWSCFRDGPPPSTCVDTAPFSIDIVADLDVDGLFSRLNSSPGPSSAVVAYVGRNWSTWRLQTGPLGITRTWTLPSPAFLYHNSWNPTWVCIPSGSKVKP